MYTCTPFVQIKVITLWGDFIVSNVETVHSGRGKSRFIVFPIGNNTTINNCTGVNCVLHTHNCKCTFSPPYIGKKVDNDDNYLSILFLNHSWWGGEMVSSVSKGK